VSRVVDAIAPPRLGPGFRWMLASSWVSNVGDGIALAAGPLLVASQTTEPMLVAAASMLQMLPWLCFGLYAGVIADRVDRRRLVVFANLVRAAVLVMLATTIVADVVDVGVVLIAMFLLGTAETFVDTTTATLLPMLVAPADLGLGNARLQFGSHTINRLAAPPIGAVLFAAGMALPFVAQALSVALAVVLVARIGATPRARATASGSVRREIADGLRWVWAHTAIRTLVLTILAFNITFGAVLGIRVLYVVERLGLGDVGFGVFVAFEAAGGILGTLVYTRLERRLRRSGIMRVGLVIETLTHLVLAVTTLPAIAFATMFVFGIHEAAWGTTASTLRQQLVPNEYQGRVTSVYLVSVLGSLVVGQGIGGVLAGVWGITAPFWFGFAGSVMILAVMWPRFGALVTEPT
jgi:MFS family permease